MRGLSLCAHTQGTRVLLISAWAWERPLKVSLKWWMRRSEWALVFNRSHLRNSTTSTSNDFLSSAVRDAESQMWTLPPLLVSFALQFFSVIEMNARHPSHFAVKYTVSAATASSPLARWSERHWLSCYDGTWREIRCTMKPLNTQKISPRLWVTLIWAVVYYFFLLCLFCDPRGYSHLDLSRRLHPSSGTNHFKYTAGLPSQETQSRAIK